MPMPTAQRVASGVGARRVIYCVGNGVWVTFAMSVALVWPFASEDGYATAAGLVNRGCFALAFFAMAVLDAQGRLGGRYTLVKITAACAAVALGLLLAGGFSAAWPIYAAAAVLGVGNCCGFCQWLRILASQGIDVAKGLLLGGSSVHILLVFAVDSWAPGAWPPWFALGVCAPLGIGLLAVNVCVNQEPSDDGPASPAACAGVLRSLRLPVVCAVALVLITPIACSVFGSTDGLAGSAVSTVAQLVSLGILAVVWFALRRNLTLPQLYCVSLPLFASAILGVSLTGGSGGCLVLGIGEGCFFLVSVLMVVTCLTVAQRWRVSPLVAYGAFAGCLYLTDVGRLAVESLVIQGAIDLELYVAALLLLYVLMIPAFCIVAPRVSRKAAGEKAAEAEGAPGEGGAPMEEVPAGARSGTSGVDTLTGEAAGTPGPVFTCDPCARVAQARGLSKRQLEVMRYLVAGRDVGRIADALGLAPNTVRSYRKSLYAALGVHGRQELLDLVEEG